MLLFASGCMAQVDTSFWFALPAATNSNPIDQRLEFQTYDAAATVTIEYFTAGGTTVDHISIPAGQHSRYDLGTMAAFTVESPQTRGVHISSDVPVSCLYDLYLDSLHTQGERYCLKGGNGLGTDFVVPLKKTSYIRNQNGEDVATAYNSIEIIATEDSTMAVLEIPERHSSDGAITQWRRDTVYLQRGESYIVRTETTNNGNYFNGSRVRSTSPITLNATYELIFEGHETIAGEQLVPTHFLGTRYVARGDGALHNIEFHITPVEDSTIVTFATEGRRATRTDTIHCNKGLILYVFAADSVSSLSIESNKPIAAMMFAGAPRGYSMTLLPNAECTGSRRIAASCANDPAYPYHYWTVTPTENISNLMVSGDTVPASAFITAPSDTSLSIQEPTYSFDFDRLEAASDSGLFQLYTFSHGYFSEGNISPEVNFLTCHTEYALAAYLRFDMGITDYFEGDNISFRFSERNAGGIHFTGPNGISIDNPGEIVVSAMDDSYTGWYYLRGDNTGCNGDSLADSVYITMHPAALFDTLLYYICDSQLPYTVDTHTFYAEESLTVSHRGSYGQDSLVTYILHVIPSSDTAIYDTITDTYLPWVFMDSTFTDTVADFIITTVNERGCDSTIHYNLYIFWNGDRCDTALFYPNVVTPNGDGINDKFVIGGLVENHCFKYNELSIYDRTGRCVYRRQNIADDSEWWDPAAHRIPAGTYFYFFKAHGVHIWTQHSGVIEVLRDR